MQHPNLKNYERPSNSYQTAAKARYYIMAGWLPSKITSIQNIYIYLSTRVALHIHQYICHSMSFSLSNPICLSLSASPPLSLSLSLFPFILILGPCSLWTCQTLFYYLLSSFLKLFTSIAVARKGGCSTAKPATPSIRPAAKTQPKNSFIQSLYQREEY